MTIQNLLLGSPGTGPEPTTPQGIEGEEFALTLTGAMEAIAEPPPDPGPPGLFTKTGNEEATPKLPIAVGPAPDLLPETPLPIFSTMLIEVIPNVDSIPEGDGSEQDLIGGTPVVGDPDNAESEIPEDPSGDSPIPAPSFGWPVLPMPLVPTAVEAPSFDAAIPIVAPISDVRPDAPVQAIATVTAAPVTLALTSLRDWTAAVSPDAEVVTSASAPTLAPKGLQVDALRQAIGTQIVSPAVLEFLEPVAITASPATRPTQAATEVPEAIASIQAPRAAAALPTISIDPAVFAAVLQDVPSGETGELNRNQASLVTSPPTPSGPTGTPVTQTAPVTAAAPARPIAAHLEATVDEVTPKPQASTISNNEVGDVPAGAALEVFPAKPTATPTGVRTAPSEQPPVQLNSRTLGVSDVAIDSVLAEVEPSPVDEARPASKATADDLKAAVTEPTVETKSATPGAPSEVERPTLRPVGHVRPEEVRSVTNQIADRIERLQEGRTPAMVTIHLDPQDLGSVTLTVRSLGRLIDADVVASSEAVRAALEQNRPQLAQAVESRGYTMGTLQFSQTQNQFAGGQSGQEQASRQDFERMANMARLQPSDDRSAPSPATWVANDQSVDYRI